MNYLLNFSKLLLLTLMLGCEEKKPDLNDFSSIIDTLIIKTDKVKGPGLMSLGVSSLDSYEKLSIDDTNLQLYPDGISSIQHYKFYPDFNNKDSYIDIVTAIRDSDTIYIIDENGNHDLRDDLLRPSEPINWDTPKNLIKVVYTYNRENKIIEDSSWLNIGITKNKMQLGRSDHRIAKFTIDTTNFEIGLVDFRNPSSFTYNVHPEITLNSIEDYSKENVSERDKVQLNEVIKLKDEFYRFSKISLHGDFITLIKDRDHINKIGTQVGMMAPQFSVVTVAGDTIKSKEIDNKVIIIANSCGCGGDIESTRAFYDIKKKYGNKALVLRVDCNIKSPSEGIHIDTSNDFNKEFYSNYRKQYCSRITYVIDPNHKIIDKFEIFEWKMNLDNLFSP